jgi:rare lipoprotein A
VLSLTACATTVQITGRDTDRGPRPGTIDVSGIPDAVPKNEPRSKYGNPSSYVVNGKTYHVLNSSRNFVERGIASWYGEKFHGRRTSSGETYDMYAMTAAHKSLPLPTYVEVTNLDNGKRIIVKVNDRGPFHDNRVIDLSYTAAAKLDILARGTGLVEVRSVEPGYTTARRERGSVEAPVVSVRTPAVGYRIGGFYIQVGAYSQLVNARNMQDRLRPLGDLVKITETMVNGSLLYRVRIGPIADVNLADNIVASLETYGVTEHQITLD